MGGVVDKLVSLAASTSKWWGGLAGWQQFALGLLAMVAANKVLGALMKPKVPHLSIKDRGYTSNIRDTQRSKAIVYGTVRLGGVIAYEEATGIVPKSDTAEGGGNRYLHRIILVAGHEINRFTQFYADGERIAGGSGGTAREGKLLVRGYTGTADQNAVPELAGSSNLWTSSHRLRGLAYIYVRFEHDRDAYPSGPPIITAEVEGKKIYTGTDGVTEFSTNPAWCIRDYLLSHPELGVEESHLDNARFEQAAEDCKVEGYNFNGFFLAETVPRVALEHLRTSMAGWYWYARGRHAIKAGKYTEPVGTFSDADFRSPIRVLTDIPTRDKITTIRGTFSGPDTNFQEAAYPEVRDDGFIQQDGREAVLDLPLPFTSDPTECQKIARIMLNRARQQISISAAFSLKAATLNIADTISLTSERMGWNAKTFEVGDWRLGLHPEQGLTVQMTLTETSAPVFAWSSNQAIAFQRDNTFLPDPFDVEIPSMSIEIEVDTQHEQIIGTLFVDVSFSEDFQGRADAVEVQLRGTDGIWRTLAAAVDGRYERVGIKDGRYSVRARLRNIYGVWGDWATRNGYEVRLFTTLPSDVPDFTAQVQGTVLLLNWQPVTDPNLSHYQLRYSSSLHGTVAGAMVLVPKIARPASSWQVPARRGSYFIKAVDKTGGKSLNAAVYRVRESLDGHYRLVASYDGAADGWAGV